MQTPSVAACAGVVPSKLGWEVHSWDKSTRTRRRSAGLTYELMVDRIAGWGASPPVYLHTVGHAHGVPPAEVGRLRRALRLLFPGVPTPLKQVRSRAACLRDPALRVCAL